MSGRGQSARFATAFVAGALVLAFVPAEVVAGGETGKVIGKGVRLKGSNVWYAHGKAVAPKSLAARVVPVPAQAVKVQWAVACQKPNVYDPAYHLATKSTSGEASVRGAGTVKFEFPYPKPHTCVATVYATLKKNGKLTLSVLQT